MWCHLQPQHPHDFQVRAAKQDGGEHDVVEPDGHQQCHLVQ